MNREKKWREEKRGENEQKNTGEKKRKMRGGEERNVQFMCLSPEIRLRLSH